MPWQTPSRTIDGTGKAMWHAPLRTDHLKTNAKNKDAVLFNMTTLCHRETSPTKQCWLLLKDAGRLDAFALDSFFLVSVRLQKDDRYGHSLREKGHLTPMEEAERYFQDLLDGKLTAAILPTLIGHLEKTKALPIKDALGQERNLFSQLFQSEAPRRGLTGFLEKRTKRFPLDLKTRQSIMDLLDWMRLPIGNNLL